VDKDLASQSRETMTTILNRSVAPRRALMLLAAFGVIAGLLAVIGIYMRSLTRRRRAQEIGVRIALGATSSDAAACDRPA
jgi:ABC-type antimicrobial peptide transport system permease subunit